MNPGTSFVDLLALERIEEDIYRGRCHAGAPLRAFGGQVAAQALVAAGRTVDEGRRVHSLHGYFLRPGRTSAPIVYLVDRIRDGRSFTTRRVTGIQHGEALFTLSASFKTPEPASEHQRVMPDLPAPETLTDVFREARGGEDPHEMPMVLDLRVPPAPAGEPGGVPRQHIWVKSLDALPDDPLLHVCTLAYMSDLTLASTANIPHAEEPGELHMASLDHAVWFHREFRADEWLLFAQQSASSSDARGLCAGEFYTRDGRLVASVVQEALIRRRAPG